MFCIKLLSQKFEKLLFSILGNECESIDYINGSDQLPPPLSKEEEQKAFDLLKRDEKKARELLIIHNLRLVVYIAKKFESTGIGIEDLVSIGTIWSICTESGATLHPAAIHSTPQAIACLRVSPNSL